jgi:diaminopimelate epimerase
MQSVGNEFVVVDAGEWPGDTDWARVAIHVCDRATGVGSDGLMVMGESEWADLRARMFNPDGTEDMCGNGIRCVLHLARERGRVGTSGVIETLSEECNFEISDNGEIATDIGRPQFHPDVLPMNLDDDEILDYPLDVDGEIVTVSVVSTGTTHTVIFVDELPDDARFFSLSPKIENHPLFPERTSVMWTRIDAPDRLTLRIWERGVGETAGCGTGAAAAVAVARTLSRIAQSGARTVASKGGELSVIYDGGADGIILVGRAETLATGTVDAEGRTQR